MLGLGPAGAIFQILIIFSFFVLVDEIPFYSMFSNLFVNAVEASPVDGQDVISVSTGSRVKIGFHNKGAVPKEIRNDFFEKYKIFGKKKGTGLGTYPAKLTAEAMGGEIRMKTSDENGTTLTMFFQKAPSK